MNQTLSTELLPEWQRIVDLIAHIAKVPVGLIMGLRDNTLTVLVSSRTKGNPYRAGETTSLPDSGLYCEHVIRSQQALQVPDALQSPQWDHNPDLARHMVAYLGFPVRYPDGTPFGTICLLDSKEHHFSQEVTELIERMRALIEGNLKMQNLLNQNAKRVSEIHEGSSGFSVGNPCQELAG
ncbi:GAF domain-containing protein [uncultured Desulfovibrio sp.]|uniref:GAF domain-containing protein n=1 Tax=uncultured Desulfovibrio sp. TaxID=167968 RepID=UPI00266D794F|nr:GAF domain-containing protein [uncultured Desulfovibrio sp.]